MFLHLDQKYQKHVLHRGAVYLNNLPQVIAAVLPSALPYLSQHSAHHASRSEMSDGDAWKQQKHNIAVPEGNYFELVMLWGLIALQVVSTFL